MRLRVLLADVIWDLEKAGQTVLASRILEDPRGKVLDTLVEAAVAWHDEIEEQEVTVFRFESRMLAAVDAYLALEGS